MTKEQYVRLENNLIGAVEYLSERTTTAKEADAILAAVQALVTLADVRQLVRDDQMGARA